MLKFLFPMLTIILILKKYKAPMWLSTLQTSLMITFISTLFLYNPFLDSSSTSLAFDINSLSSPLLTLTLVFLPLMIIASHFIPFNTLNPKTFLTMVVLLTLVLIFCFSSSNILLFYVSFELSLIPTALLIMIWGYQPERIGAVMYLLLYTISFSLPLLLALLLLYNNHSTMSFSLSFALMNEAPAPLFISLCYIMAFLVKLPMFMVHLWLPKAHVEAPVAGSMILAGVLLKLGAYGLLQILPFTPLFATSLPSLFIALSLVGAVVTAVICTQQTDMKSLIAYASVGHMGLLLAAVMTGNSWSWNGALLMMVAHGLASSALFAMANYTYSLTQSRNIFLTKGMSTILPSLTFWWFIFLALNLAAPPSLNFASEIILISSIVSGNMLTIPLVMIMVTLAAAYSMLLYVTTQHGPTSLFLTPFNPVPYSTHTTMLLHFSPLMLLILCPSSMLI